MKVDFRENGFSASMNEENTFYSNNAENDFAKNKKVSSKVAVPLLGGLGLFFSLMLIPFGFLASTGAEFCQTFLQFGYVNFIAAYIASLVILVIISLLMTVLTCVLYARSERGKSAVCGLVLAIVSIATTLVGIAYNVFVLIAHFL